MLIIEMIKKNLSFFLVKNMATSSKKSSSKTKSKAKSAKKGASHSKASAEKYSGQLDLTPFHICVKKELKKIKKKHKDMSFNDQYKLAQKKCREKQVKTQK
jgi:hypothetical protein